MAIYTIDTKLIDAEFRDGCEIEGFDSPEEFLKKIVTERILASRSVVIEEAKPAVTLVGANDFSVSTS